MTYSHLWADCLYTGISSGPSARYRVREAFTFFNCNPINSTFLLAGITLNCKFCLSDCLGRWTVIMCVRTSLRRTFVSCVRRMTRFVTCCQRWSRARKSTLMMWFSRQRRSTSSQFSQLWCTQLCPLYLVGMSVWCWEILMLLKG